MLAGGPRGGPRPGDQHPARVRLAGRALLPGAGHARPEPHMLRGPRLLACARTTAPAARCSPGVHRPERPAAPPNVDAGEDSDPDPHDRTGHRGRHRPTWTTRRRDRDHPASRRRTSRSIKMGRNCWTVAEANRARARVMCRSTSCSMTASPPASASNRDSNRRSCCSTDCTLPSRPVCIVVSSGGVADVDGWLSGPYLPAPTGASTVAAAGFRMVAVSESSRRTEPPAVDDLRRGRRACPADGWRGASGAPSSP